MIDRYSEYRREHSQDAETGKLCDSLHMPERLSNRGGPQSAHYPEANLPLRSTMVRSKHDSSFSNMPGPQWGPKELGMVFTCGAVAGALLVAVLLGPPIGRNPAEMAPLFASALAPVAAADHQPSSASTTAPIPRRVLFVGNSFIYGPPSFDEPPNTLYNLPAMVRVIAESLGQAIEVGEDTFGGCTLYAAHSPQRAQVNCWPCDCPSSSAQSTAKSSQKMDDAADGGGENDVSSSDHLSDHSTTSSSSDSARNGNGTSTILDEVEEGGDTSTPCDLASADSCGCTCVVPGTSSSSGSSSSKKKNKSSSSSSSSSGSSDASSSSSSPKPLLPRLPRAAADWVGCALPKSLPSASKASRPCPQMLNPGHNTPPWDDIVLQEHSYLPTVAAARDLYFYPALKEFMASSQHQRGAVSGKRPRLVAMMTHGYLNGTSTFPVRCPSGKGACFPLGSLATLTPGCRPNDDDDVTAASADLPTRTFECQTYALSRAYLSTLKPRRTVASSASSSSSSSSRSSGSENLLGLVDVVAPAGIAIAVARGAGPPDDDCVAAIDAEYADDEEDNDASSSSSSNKGRMPLSAWPIRVPGIQHPPKWGRNAQTAQLLYRNKGPSYASPYCPPQSTANTKDASSFSAGAYAAHDFGGAGPLLTHSFSPTGQAVKDSEEDASIEAGAETSAGAGTRAERNHTTKARRLATTATRSTSTDAAATNAPRNLVSDNALSGADSSLSSSSALISQGEFSSSSSSGSSGNADGTDVEEGDGEDLGLGCHVDHHPSAAAMYLDACVVFATLFGMSPVGAALPNGQFVGKGTAWSGGLSHGSISGSGSSSSSSVSGSMSFGTTRQGGIGGDDDDDNGGDPSLLPVGLSGVSPSEAVELQRIAEAVVLGPLRDLWKNN